MKYDASSIGQNSILIGELYNKSSIPVYEFWSMVTIVYFILSIYEISRGCQGPTYSYKTSRLDFIIQPGSQLLVYIVIIFSISYTTIVLQRNASEKLKDIILKGGILDQLRSLVRRKFLKEALGDER